MLTIPERHKYKEIHSYADILSIPDPIGSKKWDGAAFWVMIDGAGKPHFISRSLSVSGKHIERTPQLPHISDVTLPPEFANNVLYSELVHTGHSEDGIEKHNVLSGILNSGLEKSIASQKALGPVRVVLTDVAHPKASTFAEKQDILRRLSNQWGKPGLVSAASWKEGASDIRQLIENTKRRGEEGVIVTSSSLPEEKNVRYKIKHTGTYNLKVHGMNQERDISGNPKESMGALLVSDAAGKEVAAVGTGFSREDRIDAWLHPERWIGRRIQVKAMPPTARRLRAPVYNGEADGELDTLG